MQANALIIFLKLFATTENNHTTFVIPIFFFFFLFGPHLWHMEIPRLGVESELQLPAYTIAPATPDPATSVTCTAACSNTGSLTHSARPGIESTFLWTQGLVLNPLSHNRNYPIFYIPFKVACCSTYVVPWHFTLKGHKAPYGTGNNLSPSDR